MDIHNNKHHNIVDDVRYNGNKYCGIVSIINDDEINTELRWATGSKEL